MKLEPLTGKNVACVWGSLGPFFVQDMRWRRNLSCRDRLRPGYCYIALQYRAEIAWGFQGPRKQKSMWKWVGLMRCGSGGDGIALERCCPSRSYDHSAYVRTCKCCNAVSDPLGKGRQTAPRNVGLQFLIRRDEMQASPRIPTRPPRRQLKLARIDQGSLA